MEQLYDVVIVGGGPAGLTAALYLARARYRVLVLEQERFGGQIAITDQVVNYPGVERTSGAALTETMRTQAEHFGAEFRIARATGLETDGDIKRVQTDRGDVSCFGILLATGAQPRRVGFPGEEAFRGRGVAYCATCDGEFFTGQEVFVVGGGYAAAEESVFLTQFARHVTVLMRKGDFSCAASVAERAKQHKKITVVPNTVLEEVSGTGCVTELRYRNTLTGEVTQRRAPAGERFGVFVFAGYAPATDWLRQQIPCDETGYILTDPTGKTSVEGIYAAGDVRVKPLRQVVTATGDGALAATELERYAARMRQKTGRIPRLPQTPPAQHDGGKKTDPPAGTSRWFPEEVRSQLQPLLEKMERPLLLKLFLDDRPVSSELEIFARELCALTDKLAWEVASTPEPDAPCIRICNPDGRDTGLAFHGVPGGHEFTSFVLGLYNVAGPGQALEESLRREIESLPPMDLTVLVTLSCTMCPELVAAAQRIASIHPDISAQVYDLRHFENLRERFQVMSVPCLLVNGKDPAFGRKNLRQLVDHLRSAT